MSRYSSRQRSEQLARRHAVTLQGGAAVTDNLSDLLDKLATAVQEHATVTDKAIRMLSGQIEEVWADNAALRDELHSTNAALANRIEGIVRL